MELKRVVVTGMGAVSPLGNNVQETWEGLISGRSGSGLITRFNAEKFKTKFACEVKNFDPQAIFDRKELRKLDRYSQFALFAAEEAMRDSGLDLDTIDKDMVGVIIGSGIGGIDTFLEEIAGYVNGDYTPRFSPFFIPKMISDIAAGHISMKYQLRGPNFGIVSACATSTNAIIDACNYIRLGKANAFLTGGSEATINPASLGGFNSLQAISTRNEDYMTASRPFDISRDGFVMGEGSGILVLEELEHALNRGAKIYAELVGTGMSADAYHMTAPHPEGEGAYLVMKRALEEAGMKGDDLDYINVHGTATPLGDIAEAKAIVRLFGEDAYRMNLSSTKSMTGHLLGAAGAIEAMATILACVHDIVPPTINLNTIDPELDSRLNFTPNTAQKRTVRSALSNTFGFGGHNASVIFKKFTA